MAARQAGAAPGWSAPNQHLDYPRDSPDHLNFDGRGSAGVAFRGLGKGRKGYQTSSTNESDLLDNFALQEEDFLMGKDPNTYKHPTMNYLIRQVCTEDYRAHLQETVSVPVPPDHHYGPHMQNPRRNHGRTNSSVNSTVGSVNTTIMHSMPNLNSNNTLAVMAPPIPNKWRQRITLLDVANARYSASVKAPCSSHRTCPCCSPWRSRPHPGKFEYTALGERTSEALNGLEDELRGQLLQQEKKERRNLVRWMVSQLRQGKLLIMSRSYQPDLEDPIPAVPESSSVRHPIPDTSNVRPPTLDSRRSAGSSRGASGERKRNAPRSHVVETIQHAQSYSGSRHGNRHYSTSPRRTVELSIGDDPRATQVRPAQAGTRAPSNSARREPDASTRHHGAEQGSNGQGHSNRHSSDSNTRGPEPTQGDNRPASGSGVGHTAPSGGRSQNGDAGLSNSEQRGYRPLGPEHSGQAKGDMPPTPPVAPLPNTQTEGSGRSDKVAYGGGEGAFNPFPESQSVAVAGGEAVRVEVIPLDPFPESSSSVIVVPRARSRSRGGKSSLNMEFASNELPLEYRPPSRHDMVAPPMTEDTHPGAQFMPSSISAPVVQRDPTQVIHMARPRSRSGRGSSLAPELAQVHTDKPLEYNPPSRNTDSVDFGHQQSSFQLQDFIQQADSTSPSAMSASPSNNNIQFVPRARSRSRGGRSVLPSEDGGPDTPLEPFNNNNNPFSESSFSPKRSEASASPVQTTSYAALYLQMQKNGAVGEEFGNKITNLNEIIRSDGSFHAIFNVITFVNQLMMEQSTLRPEIEEEEKAAREVIQRYISSQLPLAHTSSLERESRQLLLLEEDIGFRTVLQKNNFPPPIKVAGQLCRVMANEKEGRRFILQMYSQSVENIKKSWQITFNMFMWTWQSNLKWVADEEADKREGLAEAEAAARFELTTGVVQRLEAMRRLQILRVQWRVFNEIKVDREFYCIQYAEGNGRISLTRQCVTTLQSLVHFFTRRCAMHRDMCAGVSRIALEEERARGSAVAVFRAHQRRLTVLNAELTARMAIEAAQGSIRVTLKGLMFVGHRFHTLSMLERRNRAIITGDEHSESQRLMYIERELLFIKFVAGETKERQRLLAEYQKGLLEIRILKLSLMERGERAGLLDDELYCRTSLWRVCEFGSLTGDEAASRREIVWQYSRGTRLLEREMTLSAILLNVVYCEQTERTALCAQEGLEWKFLKSSMLKYNLLNFLYVVFRAEETERSILMRTEAQQFWGIMYSLQRDNFSTVLLPRFSADEGKGRQLIEYWESYYRGEIMSLYYVLLASKKALKTSTHRCSREGSCPFLREEDCPFRTKLPTTLYNVPHKVSSAWS